MAPVNIREGSMDDAPAIHDLILGVAIQHVFPTLDAEGQSTFRNSLATDVNSILENGTYLVAGSERFLGVCGYRTNGHVNHLFVLDSERGKGIGKRLLAAAQAQLGHPDLGLNASLNAISFYESLGFSPVGPVSETNGIRFQNMRIATQIQTRIDTV